MLSAALAIFAQALMLTLRTLGILRTESIRLWSGSQQPKYPSPKCWYQRA